MNPEVDVILKKAAKWREEFERLRSIILACGLSEEVKWGWPCYTFPDAESKQQNNVVLMHGFKDYCALLFFKGALLKDTHGILIRQTENVQAARQVRFTTAREIIEMEDVLKEYIREAVEIEKSGLKVELRKTYEYKIPVELKNKFDELPALKAAFEALTPGRQRAYIFYFSQPKQSVTRDARIEKSMKQILNGKGLND